MASSSKNISMPLVFAVSIGAVFAMVAITVFAMGWLEFESRKVTAQRLEGAPTHTPAYEKAYNEQEASLHKTTTYTYENGAPDRHVIPIEDAMLQIQMRYDDHDHDHDHDHADGDADEDHNGHDHDHDDHGQ